jgi:hypothetical protein
MDSSTSSRLRFRKNIDIAACIQLKPFQRQRPKHFSARNIFTSLELRQIVGIGVS